MFEARGKTNRSRIATLLGSTMSGELLTHTQAKEIIEHLTCMDDQCDAPLQVVRGTPARRGHFRHVPGTGMACRAPETFGEGEWHKELKLGVLGAAWKHEYSVPGARADVVVKRRSGSLVALEVQASSIDRETVLARHAAHRAAGIAGTIWIVDRKHLTKDEDAIKTRWVIDLVQACMDTPASAKGESGYGCTVGFIDTQSSEDQIVFVDRVDLESAGHRDRLRILSRTGFITVAALSWWAAGDQRPTEVPEELASDVKFLDSLPTRRVKGPLLWDEKGRRVISE